MDRKLRNLINDAPTSGSIAALLADEGLTFTREEFEQAHSNLLANSQTGQEASVLAEIAAWWHFIHTVVGR